MCESLRRFVYMIITANIRCLSDVCPIENSFDITYTQSMNKGKSVTIEFTMEYTNTYLSTVKSKHLTTPPTTIAVVWVTVTVAEATARNERK